jgi:hypothetical protein
MANPRLQPTSSTVWQLDHRFKRAGDFVPNPLPQQNLPKGIGIYNSCNFYFDIYTNGR